MKRWSLKTKQKAARNARVAAVLLLCVLLISPLRNAVLSPFLPGLWRDYSTVRLVQMLMDNQHFPIESPFSHRHDRLPTTLRVNLSDVSKYMYEEDPFAEFFQLRAELVQKASQGDVEAAEELATIDGFKPVTSLEAVSYTHLTLPTNIAV